MASFRLILSKWGIVECLIVSGMYIYVPYKLSNTVPAIFVAVPIGRFSHLGWEEGGTQEGWICIELLAGHDPLA